MKAVFVSIVRAILNAYYRRCCNRCERGNIVLFLSRQTDDASYDYRMLAQEFERQGFQTIIHVKKLSARTVLPYVGHVFREMRYLSQCRVCILDRYDPVVSLVNFKSDIDQDAKAANLHYEFPIEPVVIQLWHAFGAYKKFGYQSVDTREGHSLRTAKLFDIHRNYSWVVCSGEGCRTAFSQAFACPVSRVAPLCRPEYNELQDLQKQLPNRAGTRFSVMFAPTLRKSPDSQHPFRELYLHNDRLQGLLDADIVWSFHPLEEGDYAPGNVSENLRRADVVVTDYSSIAYEAYLLHKKVLFYVPDIDEYRTSPGLNADPQKLCPEICCTSEDSLTSALSALIDSGVYQFDSLAVFAASAFNESYGNIAQSIVEFTRDHI